MVDGEAAQIGDFFHFAARPVVRVTVGGFFFVQINVFWADGNPDGLPVFGFKFLVGIHFGGQFGAVDERVGFVFVHQLAFEDVGFADEFGSEAAVGVVVHIGGRAHLLQFAVRHNRHAACHGHGFFLVVRYHNAGYAHFFQRVYQFKLGLLAQFFVQRAQGFV